MTERKKSKEREKGCKGKERLHNREEKIKR